jgi:hypothetical protein
MEQYKQLRNYQEYETLSHGRVVLLKYKEGTPEKRKVCKVGDDPKDYFFLPESELILHERIRKKRDAKRTPVVAQREYNAEMKEKGYKPKLFYISDSNMKKLEDMKRKTTFRTWNDFINDLIEHL